MLRSRPLKSWLLAGLPWVFAAPFAGCAAAPDPGRPPNIIILFADDLGYGDLGCYGHPTARTPHLDRMAREGIRFTQFYSASSVCTPSRAALLTGRLPIRSGMCSDTRRVLFPDSKGGLPAGELTLAEALKTKGYTTACIGKWHLGHRPEHLPLQHGFDSYLGLPYSNDMDRTSTAPKGRAAFDDPRSEYWNVPLMRDGEIIERPARQETLTQRYTIEAQRIIHANVHRPFLIYLPYTMVHVPLFAAPAFRGESTRGLYGDALQEIDWSVGQILGTLRALGLDENTLVVFTSDNGPWLTFHDQGGSAGLLRLGKGSTFEGGMREPCIAWWPGGIAHPGTVSQELSSTMDLYTTCLALAGVPVPADRVVDGVDLTAVLRGTGPSPRSKVAFYRGTQLFAWRRGPFKAHFVTRRGYGPEPAVSHDPPLLFHLEHDPSEKRNIAADHPEVLAAIRSEIAAHKAELSPVPSQLDARED